MVLVAAVIAAVWLSGSPESAEPPTPEPSLKPRSLVVEVLDSMPHDPEAYTQGLLWHEGFLYESTGQYGQSTLRRIEPSTGEVLESRALDSNLFGEGLARVDSRLIQLTWKEETALVWDRKDMREVARHSYTGQGWGLCFDGDHLVMSDGTSRLRFRDPETFEIRREIEVLLGDGAVGRLNELECVEGWVYANVYTTHWIVQIDPQTGHVRSLIDASGLLSSRESAGVDVLNGIAYDPEDQVFYLTGKLWPKVFAVRFVSAGPGPSGR
jgi:glutamine cyclotransferase